MTRWLLASSFWFLALPVFAANLSGYAWSSNIGWIKFSGANYGVTMSDAGNFSGSAWSPNIGWLIFNGQRARTIGWDGEVRMRGSRYAVTPDADNCHLQGWAWGSEVIGWVHFSGPNYAVSIDGCAPIVATNPPQCSFVASPALVPRGARSTLSWNCNATADSCAIVEAGADALAGSGSLRTAPLMNTKRFTLACDNIGGHSTFNTEIRVVRPAYCEVIPFVGGCR